MEGNKNKLYFVKSSDKKYADVQSILEVQKREANNFAISHEIPQKTNCSTQEKINNEKNNTWIIVKYYNENKGFSLNLGDCLKLGRTKMRLIEQSFASFTAPKNLSISKKNHIEMTENSLEVSTRQTFCCRICLSESNINDSYDNPFMSPCKCSGSMKYIHWNCLCKWMRNKMQMNDGVFCTTLIWKNFKCELCHTPIPCIKIYNSKN